MLCGKIDTAKFIANLTPREKCYEKYSASGEEVQIAIAVRGEILGLRCSADRVMYKCGCGADSGQKLLMRCRQGAQIFCPCHL